MGVDLSVVGCRGNHLGVQGRHRMRSRAWREDLQVGRVDQRHLEGDLQVEMRNIEGLGV